MKFQVRLDTGRTLGPIGLDRIRKLILKKHIRGGEQARVHPGGKWKAIEEIPELAALLLEGLEGRLSGSPPVAAPSAETVIVQTEKEPEQARPQQQVEPHTRLEKPLEVSYEISLQSVPALSEEEKTQLQRMEVQPPSSPMEVSHSGMKRARALEVHERDSEQELRDEPTRALQFFPSTESPVGLAEAPGPGAQASAEAQKKNSGGLRPGVVALLAGVLLLLFWDSIFPPAPKDARSSGRPLAIRAEWPSRLQPQDGVPSDPQASGKALAEAIRYYRKDHVRGYVQAAKYLKFAIERDPSNVKAMALLASSYLNLIDSTNKDEKFFAIVSTLIDVARARQVDLTEQVVADAEYFLVTGRLEAAKQRLVEFTKKRGSFDPFLFFQVAEVFLASGDALSAAKYLELVPEKELALPKVRHFKGRLAEAQGQWELALQEYAQALALEPAHARSHLARAALLDRLGKIQEARMDLAFLAENPDLLSPIELGRAHFYSALLKIREERWADGITLLERAAAADPENSRYRIELYALRAKLGTGSKKEQNQVRMYLALAEGERLQAEGKFSEALGRFIEAKSVNPSSFLPALRMGDLFLRKGEAQNARTNYQQASERAPQSLRVWSKYIDSLIRTYDFVEAKKAMAKLSEFPQAASVQDKVAGDLFARQGNHPEAQAHYRRAMEKERIDPTVYQAFGQSLLATRNFREAPLYFSMARRFDPSAMEPVIGTAQAIAEMESLDSALQYLRQEMQKAEGSRAELLVAAARLHLQRGDWSAAQRLLDEARRVNPEYAPAWKVQAEVHQVRESVDPQALDLALSAYQSYSNRNASDPSGYLERYRIFLKQKKYDQAVAELDSIYQIQPHYPALHFYRGSLDLLRNQPESALQEFKRELEQNSQSYETWISKGKAEIALGKPAQALESFQVAMGLKPQSPESKALAGYANFLNKNYPAAIALFNSALSMDRGNPVLYKRLGLVYRAMGDSMRARTAFRKYLEMEPDAADKEEIRKYL